MENNLVLLIAAGKGLVIVNNVGKPRQTLECNAFEMSETKSFLSAEEQIKCVLDHN